MRKLKEEYLIKVDGTQEGEGVHDKISLCTRGEFFSKNRHYYILYNETEATGYAGCTTTVRVQGQDKVSLLRFGPAPSQLILERGVRHICHYETGQGSFSLGLAADEIKSDLSEKGGELFFSYLLDTGSDIISKNTIHITVRKA